MGIRREKTKFAEESEQGNPTGEGENAKVLQPNRNSTKTKKKDKSKITT
jgi:hypothetical protein